MSTDIPVDMSTDIPAYVNRYSDCLLSAYIKFLALVVHIDFIKE